MITAIAQFNGDNKGFEALEHYDDNHGESSRRVGFTTHSKQKHIDYWYGYKVSNEAFFQHEKKYHLGFRLEFIV